MPKGGARVRSGPTPTTNALRESGEWTTIAADAKAKRTPAWPLPTKTPREAALWKKLWQLPQSVLWEQNQQALEVALHVRSYIDAEHRMATTASRTLVRQQMDSLLLTIPSLRAARVKIVPVDAPAPKSPRGGRAPAASTSRDRLRVVRGSGG